MEELLKKLKNLGLEIPTTDVSTAYVEGSDNKLEIDELKKFLNK